MWLLLTGEIGRGVALMAIGAGGISLIDNFLRPMLLAGRTQMNGLLVFISLLGGIATFGLLGLVLGPGDHGHRDQLRRRLCDGTKRVDGYR